MRRALLLVLALVAAGCGPDAPATGAPPAADQPAASSSFAAFDKANLIIISLDTLRADDTSVGGGLAELTPTLQKLAAESVCFENARAQAPHTAPSHMSLFTSTFPSVHDVQNVSFNQELAVGEEKKAIIQPAKPDVPTLAEVLHAADFQTIGLTDGGNLNPPHGFNRGFDTYTYELQGAEDKVKLGTEWVAKLAAQKDKRFFLFWHTYQIHSPYCPPASYLAQWAPASYQGFMRERIESLSDKSFKERWSAKGPVFWKDRETFGQAEAEFLHGVYRAGIRYTDDELARLIQALRDSGLLDTSILVVLSDHGEEFFEHGHWQHEDLFEECVRVPLLVRLPGGRNGGTRLRTPVALIDVMPTALDLLGVDPSTLSGLPGRVRHDGTSLGDALLTRHEPKSRAIVSELIATRAKGGDYEMQVAIHANGMSFVHDKVRGHRDPANPKIVIFDEHLYDLSKDPGQKTDLASQGGGILESFRKLFQAHELRVQLEQASGSAAEQVEVPPEMERDLKTLGYAGGGAQPAPRPQATPVTTAESLLADADAAWDAGRTDEARVLYKRLRADFAQSTAYAANRERVDARAGN